MSSKDQPLGSIFISHRSIASIAHQCALESYGVVGLAPKNLAAGFADVIVKDPMKGVNVDVQGSDVSIDLFVIIEYGTRIKSVTDNLTDLVTYRIENTTGLSVIKVNVHVRGLRISNTD